MKYTGRIIGICIVIVSSLYVCIRFLNYGVWAASVQETVIGIILTAIICWFLGKQYDKARYYFQPLKQRQQQVTDSEIKYRSVVEEMFVGVYMIQGHSFIYVNPYLEKLTGYSEEELLNINYLDLIPSENYDRLIEIVNNKLLLNAGQYIHTQCNIVKKDKSILDVEIRAKSILYKEKLTIVGMIMDITERKKTETQWKHMAFHDPLTGLPNRYYINEYLNKAITKAANEKEHTFAVLFMDLDRFKDINDTYGHHLADELLKQVSSCLSSVLRPHDMAARYGGDEFVILLDKTHPREVEELAKRLLKALNDPFLISDYELFITPSIGISFYPENGTDMDTLIKNADTAMYYAKRLGKNNYQFYNSSMDQQTNDYRLLEQDLRKSISRNELVLHYQPMIDIETQRIVGMEALIRWNHEKLGFISPAEFIPLAEESELIISIGEWVLRTACKQNKSLLDAGYAPLRVSVNISAIQFQKDNFIETVSSILEETGLNPHYLELEITESITMDITNCINKLHALKELGIEISIDDFGTGYSSLNYLKQLPVNTLKIDQSFVRGISEGKNDKAIVKSIISLAHSLGLKVVAEGVETNDQFLFLKAHQCNKMQGFLFSRPVPFEEFINILVRQLENSKPTYT